jgi:hypothetical protein
VWLAALLVSSSMALLLVFFVLLREGFLVESRRHCLTLRCNGLLILSASSVMVDLQPLNSPLGGSASSPCTPSSIGSLLA